jgi:fluoride ion exporter CrcB/FEX
LGIVFKDLPANMFGCFIIGIFAPYKAEFSKTIPTLNLLVMTALCGSITTWSSWNITLS